MVATSAEISSSISVDHREKILRPRSFAYFHSLYQEPRDFLELNSIVASINKKIVAKSHFLEARLGCGAPDYDDFLMACSGKGESNLHLKDAQVQPFDFISLCPSEYLRNELFWDRTNPLPLTKEKKMAFIHHLTKMDLESDLRMDYDSMWSGDSASSGSSSFDSDSA